MKLIIATIVMGIIWTLGCFLIYWLDVQRYKEEMKFRSKYPQASKHPSKPIFRIFKKSNYGKNN